MNRRYTVIMVLSFVYGGFLLTSYALTLYSVLMKEDIPGPLGVFVNEGVPGVHGGARFVYPDNVTQNVSSEQKTSNVTDTRRLNNTVYRNAAFQRRVDPMESISSPLMLLYLLGGMICIGGGLSIRQLTHEREIKKVKTEMKELLLNPDEKQLIEELQKSGGDLTQKNLTDLTGFSRVKTHRIIQRLEAKKIVRKIPNGQTNRIILVTDKTPDQENTKTGSE